MKPAGPYEPSELLSWYLDIAEGLISDGRLAHKERESLAALLADLKPRVARPGNRSFSIFRNSITCCISNVVWAAWPGNLRATEMIKRT
jgi:hypothetical protein